jgi:hypothetical protein
MRFLYNNRLRKTLKSVYPDLYKLKQIVEWHRHYNGNFQRLVSLIEKLSRNYSNQLANLGSSEETHSWIVDDELSGIAKSLKPQLYLAGPQAPTVCTVALGREYQAVVAPCLKATQEYCARHQYNYLLLTESPPNLSRPYAWAKVCLLFQALEHGYQNIMWLDADALITNVEAKLEAFLTTLEQADKSMLITEIYYGINTGVFFLRGGWKSRTLLNLIWCNRFYISHGWWEQAALMDLMRRHVEVANEEYIEPRTRSFNSHAPELAKDPNIAWQPGDFIIHFAGARGSQLSELIVKYSELRAPIRG